MRKARQDELPALAALMFDQFYEKEELRQQFPDRNTSSLQ